MSDSDIRHTIAAAEVAISENEWDRAEDALTQALGQVRKRVVEESPDDG